MSRLYEALRRLEKEQRQPGTDAAAEPAQPADQIDNALSKQAELERAPAANVEVSPASRLVALTDPKSLGAEKFRALVTRLENLRQKRELKCLQITSGVMNEGKTVVAGNLAVTLAKHSGFKVLLVEGDLHKPELASQLGLSVLPGLSHWWAGQGESIARYVHKLNDMPLWFLSAGVASEQPSQILQSARFAEAFGKLSGEFDWIIVDSTPMLPAVDANLWSRLMDGMLLVVREGVTPIKALKRGLAALDNPKLVGVILNEASEFDLANYQDQYYTGPRNGNDRHKRPSRSVFETARAWLPSTSRHPKSTIAEKE